MTTSPDFGVPFVSESQAQANVTHNEGLQALATVLLHGVDDRGINTPPGSPADGDAYILGAAPTGAWSGHANQIAYYLSGWRFIPGVDNAGAVIPIGTAHEGLSVYVKDENRIYTWSGTAWLLTGDTYQTIATDAIFTLTPGTSPKFTRHTGTLTANRVVTLSTTGAVLGDSFKITRTGAGAFNLDIGGLKNLTTGQWAEVVYDGSAWYLSAFGSL